MNELILPIPGTTVLLFDANSLSATRQCVQPRHEPTASREDPSISGPSTLIRFFSHLVRFFHFFSGRGLGLGSGPQHRPGVPTLSSTLVRWAQSWSRRLAAKACRAGWGQQGHPCLMRADATECWRRCDCGVCRVSACAKSLTQENLFFQIITEPRFCSMGSKQVNFFGKVFRQLAGDATYNQVLPIGNVILMNAFQTDAFKRPNPFRHIISHSFLRELNTVSYNKTQTLRMSAARPKKKKKKNPQDH